MDITEYKKICNPPKKKSMIRPFMGGKTWENETSLIRPDLLEDIRVKDEPIINLLNLYEKPQNSWLTQKLYYNYMSIFSRKVASDYPPILHMKKWLLKHERLFQVIQKEITIENLGKEIDDKASSKMEIELTKRSEKILNKMLATVTSPVIRFAGWLYLTLLRKLTTAVHLHPGQIEVIREVSKGPYPVVYLPLHFSHLDYILLSLVLYHYDIRCPFIASGDNLHLPLFSYFMRRAGGFFIRRKSNNINKKDLIYRELLNMYITELLKKNQSLEIFLEGGRTRSGLPNYPKTGLLSILIEAVIDSHVEDIVVVPICIGYEKLIEGNFNNELMGLPKKKESFLNSILEITKMLCGSYGHIRLDFGQPKLLKESLTKICSSCEITFSDLRPSNTVLQQSVLGSYEDLTQLGDVKLVGEHFIYSCLETRSFMSTQLLCFLLLHRFRNGVSMETLVEAFQQLNVYLLTQGRDVGFSGKPWDVVVHALSILGSRLITCENKVKFIKVKRRASRDSGCELESSEDSEIKIHSFGSQSDEELPQKKNNEKTIQKIDFETSLGTEKYMKMSESGIYTEMDLVCCNNSAGANKDYKNKAEVTHSPTRQVKEQHYLRIKPNTTVPVVFELNYYSNALIPVFAIESLVALSLSAVTDFHFSMLTDLAKQSECKIAVSSLPNKVRMPMLRSKLLDKALGLSDLLQIDIYLCDVTESIEQVISNGIDNLVANGCLSSEHYGVSTAVRKSQVARDLCFEDEDNLEDLQERWMKINFSNLSELLFYQSIISPHLETYTATAKELPMFIDTCFTESEFVRHMCTHISDLCKIGKIRGEESCSSDLVKNALRSFITTGVLDKLPDGSITLTSDYNDPESLHFLHERFMQYSL